MHIPNCPVLLALVRSRGLRKADQRAERILDYPLNEVSVTALVRAGNGIMQSARQRIARVLAKRLAKYPQISVMTQREFEGMKSVSYASVSQIIESQETETWRRISETMKSITYELSSRFTETRELPSCDFLRL